MKSWIDIENPPQVQYLAPFRAALQARGHDVLVTARDQAMTVELLRERGIEPVVVGGDAASSRAGKMLSVTARAGRLARHAARGGRPVLLIASSRPSNLAAWALRIPSFQFTDYEHSHSTIARHTGTYLLHPDVIDAATLTEQGYRSDRLVPFPGLKEAISFSGIDIDAVESHPFPEAEAPGRVKVLFRPPGEAAHYFVEESLEVAFDLLERLARREDVVVLYLPRYPSQVSYLDRYSWRHPPIVLRGGTPFVSLLKAVDAVISSGGTMLREAAYLGIPAFSILRSEIGEVDRYLESLGRLTIVERDAEFPRLAPGPVQLDVLPARSPDIVGEITDSILALADRSRA